MIKFVLVACVMLAGLLPTFAAAAPAILNSTGGTNSTNGLKIYVDPSTQIQVLSSGSGQLYSPNATPPSNVLDNGIYIRANGTLYGPDNFAYNASGNYSSTSVGTVSPSTASQGVVQTTTSKFTLPNQSALVAGPQVQVDWSYTYPYTFVTASVTITIPLLYPVSSSNPVRYYHAVDTYLGGSDCGCGVRYVDTNGHQVAGTYPLSGSSCSSGGSTTTTCPSSTSLPANLNIVESFRERNGSFSHYCVGSWSTFWSNSTSHACAIGKSTTLADTVNTKLMDTGAAIEYDFTAPGTYTFSYDFVVGSTAVPNYDHLEVQHAGSATLCPTTVQVLACTSSTVPCPSDSIVNTGSLTGSLTFTPTIPSVSQTPSSFQVGADGASVATVTLQASGAGTVVFGATGLSKLPQNGVKCWNTATSSQTCNFIFTSTPCVSTFECMESSLTYNNLQTNSSLRNPIYTKVLASSFNLDVVAVLANGSQSSGYNATTGLIVDLVTDSGGSCSSNVVATKLVSFATSDSGRKTVAFSSSDVIAANANLRCRVRDLTLGVTGCSSDNFSMRPQSFTISSSNATQLSPGPGSTPVFRAGRDYFNLIATTGELGYTGTPVIDNSKLLAHSGAPAVGQVSGNFATATLGVSSGSTFTYSEVGHFQFLAQGVYDSTFTAVDSAKGDCDNTSSPFNNAGSGSPTMYGCRFGNTASSNYFGRFIPDHFLVTPGSGVTQACGAFTYYGQDSTTSPGFTTPFTLTAQNAANGTTQNYTGSYATFVLSNWNNYQFSASPLNGATLTASTVSPAVTGTWNNGVASVVANHMLSRPSSAVSPQTITISTQPQYIDSGVTVSSTQTVLSSNVPYRYGRLYLYNAHGSELLALPVQVEAQYWNGSAYIRSLGDSCTSVPLSTIVMQNYKGNLAACETYLTGSTTMSNGVLGLKLTAPGVSGSGQPNTGSVDLEVNLGTAASTDKTCLSNVQSSATSGVLGWFGTNPTSRASFGIYKAPVIYMRENF